jgi:hypothetical protein
MFRRLNLSSKQARIFIRERRRGIFERFLFKMATFGGYINNLNFARGFSEVQPEGTSRSTFGHGLRVTSGMNACTWCISKTSVDVERFHSISV